MHKGYHWVNIQFYIYFIYNKLYKEIISYLEQQVSMNTPY